MFLVTKFTWFTSRRDTTKCRRTVSCTKHIANWREHPGSSNHDSEQNPHSTLRFAVSEISIPKNKSTGNLLSHASGPAMGIDTVRPRMSFDAGSLDIIARCVKERIFPGNKAMHREWSKRNCTLMCWRLLLMTFGMPGHRSSQSMSMALEHQAFVVSVNNQHQGPQQDPVVVQVHNPDLCQ